jgi:uncharacterized Ntn-hydrolase superfamily protein
MHHSTNNLILIAMPNRIRLALAILSVLAATAHAQDTFSIVAADSTTREVGSAGASCVDLIQFNIPDAGFLGDLLPDTGAINTQAWYLPANQQNARNRMREGQTPEQIITSLVQSDAGDNPSLRQYGIAGFTGNAVSAAGYTGANTDDYKAHRTGSIDGIHYSIQGNILLGPQIIDSMEARFRRAEGDLACRLMAALQGAKVVGADTRCAPNGTSTLFAFLKVAQPTDTYGAPSFSLGVRTRNNQRIEPIDSLQVLFDAVKACGVTSIASTDFEPLVRVFPNPSGGRLSIELLVPDNPHVTLSIYNAQGILVQQRQLADRLQVIDLGDAAHGWHVFRVDVNGRAAQTGKIFVD